MAQPLEVRKARRGLGQQLAAYRKFAGFTQHSLALRVLAGRSTIANTEVGLQHPNRAFWQRCDEVLDTKGALTAGYDQVASFQQQYRPGRLQSRAFDEAFGVVAGRAAGASRSRWT